MEDAIRNAISLGRDVETMACIAGGIADAFFRGVPDEIVARTMADLDEPLTAVLTAFREKFADRSSRGIV